MPAGAPLHSKFEPSVLRLQLELQLARGEAEACVRAGYTSAALIAAADDARFHEEVRLAPEERRRVLARARQPGSKAQGAGEAPVRARDRRPAEAVVRISKPVLSTVAKLAGEPPAKAAAPAGPKAAPPHALDARRRARRASASEVEAELDERLRQGD